MTKIYMIKDKTDANFRKPFVSLHKSDEGAKRKLMQITSRLPAHIRNLVSVDSIDVKDFDPNKSSIYVIFNKADTQFKSPVVAMYSDYQHAFTEVEKMKRSVAKPVQKLVYAQSHQLET